MNKNKIIAAVSILLVGILLLLVLLLDMFKNKAPKPSDTITPTPTAVVDFNESGINEQQLPPNEPPHYESEDEEIDFPFSQDEKSTLTQFNSKLPAETDSFSIDYSDLLKQYYLQEKEGTDSAKKIDEFLSTSGVSDVFKSRPELLSKTKTNPTQQKQSAEKRYKSMISQYKQSKTSSLQPTPTSVPKIKQLPEIKLLNKLMQGIITYKIDKPDSTQQSTSPPIPIGSVVIGDTSNISCETGADNDIQDGYANGQLYKIRTCNVQGIIVNSQISDEVNRLLSGAKSTGLNIGGGGYRTMAGQIAARQRNGCPDIYNAPSSSCSTPVARPGFSNHQMGLAIDFTCNGSIVSRGDGCFAWLASNARNYGLINFEREPWHWSINGR